MPAARMGRRFDVGLVGGPPDRVENSLGDGDTGRPARRLGHVRTEFAAGLVADNRPDVRGAQVDPA